MQSKVGFTLGNPFVARAPQNTNLLQIKLHAGFQEPNVTLSTIILKLYVGFYGGYVV